MNLVDVNDESILLIIVDNDSKIFVDGELIIELIKNTPYKLTVFPGQHIIEANSLDGKFTWKEIIFAPKNEQRIVNIILKPIDNRIGIPGKFIDPRDKKSYKTITINGKTWLAENFKFDNKHMNTCFNNDSNHCQTHGRLYSYLSAMNTAPLGWHVATRQDWDDLIKIYQDPFIDLGINGIANFNMALGGMARFLASSGKFNFQGSVGVSSYYWINEGEAGINDGVKQVWALLYDKVYKFRIDKVQRGEFKDQYARLGFIRLVKDND